MAFTHSRSATNVLLELYEVEALIQFHRDNQWEAANNEEYQDAANSKQRGDQLEESLKAHRLAFSEQRNAVVGSQHPQETEQ